MIYWQSMYFSAWNCSFHLFLKAVPETEFLFQGIAKCFKAISNASLNKIFFCPKLCFLLKICF